METHKHFADVSTHLPLTHRCYSSGSGPRIPVLRTNEGWDIKGYTVILLTPPDTFLNKPSGLLVRKGKETLTLYLLH
jgi:hypothetical protein